MKPIFLLLGGNKLNYGIAVKFQRKGFLVYVVDWNAEPSIKGDRHYKLDVKDYKSIIYTLQRDKVLEQVKFVYSSIDVAVESVVRINKQIGLKTMDYDSLVYTSSKSMMTKRWEEAGLLNRISKKFTEYNNEIGRINQKKKIIIKPDNSSSSRGITIVDINSDKKTIDSAFKKAQMEATNSVVVVEEFIEGVEFTVEMIGDDCGHVCVYGISRKSHTRNTSNNRIAVKLHYNAIPLTIQHKIAKTAILCYKALGFKSSLGHLEIIMKDDGSLSPVEIGARSSGFIASDLVDIVSGSDFLGDFLSVQNGSLVEDGLHNQTEKTSVYFFYDFPNKSTVTNKCSLLDFCDSSIISRYNDRSSIVLGNRFLNIDNDNSRYGYEILEGPKDLLTIDYLKNIEQKMLNYMLE